MKKYVGQGEILDLLLKKHDISVADLARMCDIPAVNIYAMRSRNTRTNSAELLTRICSCLNEPLQLFTEYDETAVNLYLNNDFNFFGYRNLDDNDREALDCLFKDKNKDISYLSNILAAMGETAYTEEHLKNIYSGLVAIPYETFSLIIDILKDDVIISKNEYYELMRYRKLHKDQQQTIKSMFKGFEERNQFHHDLYFSSQGSSDTKSDE